MELGNFLSLLRCQQFKQTDFGVYHAVNFLRFDLRDLVGDGSHLRFFYFAGMHQLVQLHVSDFVLCLQHDSFLGETEFLVFDLDDLCIGQS